MAPMSDRDRALWALRFGTLAGGALGLDLAFALAYAVDHLMHADPVWPLRIASAVGMLAGGLGGRRLGAWQGGRLYAALGAAAGLMIAGALGILMTAVFRAA